MQRLAFKGQPLSFYYDEKVSISLELTTQQNRPFPHATHRNNPEKINNLIHIFQLLCLLPILSMGNTKSSVV